MVQSSVFPGARRPQASRLRFAAILMLHCAVLQADWLTFNHDPQRSGWAAEEHRLNAQNVKDLALAWSIPLENQSLALNALTAPLVAHDVVTPAGVKTLVYVAGSSNLLFAVDAAQGKLVWQRTFQSFVNAKGEPFFLCPNAINATPVIDRRQNLIFAIAQDGRLFGLDLGTGSIRFGPFQFVPPFAKPWSLNLSNGFIYTTTSQGCGGDRSGIYSMQVDSPLSHSIFETLVRSGSGAGMWSRGGTAIGEHGRIFASTGDGPFDPSRAEYGSTFLAASTPALTITDYYSPLNFEEVNKRDLDLPSGGLLSFAYRDFELIVGGGKESALYLLDAGALGAKDHRTALDVSIPLGNPQKLLEGKGLWGSPALWRDESGLPWIFVPLWGDVSPALAQKATAHGPTPHGSIVALQVVLDPQTRAPHLRPAWISPDIDLPDSPVVANGVVFVAATGENPQQVKLHPTSKDWKENLLTTGERASGTHPQVLFALDAKTGNVLYTSANAMKSWNHFGGLAIDDGKIYAVDHDSRLYCFGVRVP